MWPPGAAHKLLTPHSSSRQTPKVQSDKMVFVPSLFVTPSLFLSPSPTLVFLLFFLSFIFLFYSFVCLFLSARGRSSLGFF